MCASCNGCCGGLTFPDFVQQRCCNPCCRQSGTTAGSPATTQGCSCASQQNAAVAAATSSGSSQTQSCCGCGCPCGCGCCRKPCGCGSCSTASSGSCSTGCRSCSST